MFWYIISDVENYVPDWIVDLIDTNDRRNWSFVVLKMVHQITTLIVVQIKRFNLSFSTINITENDECEDILSVI